VSSTPTFPGNTVSVCRRIGGLAALLLALAAPASAQRVLSKPEQIMTIAKGASLLLENDGTIQRFSIGDPTVAEATVLSPREVLISGKTLGVTTLLVWNADASVKLYSVEVTADAAGLERYLNTVLPGQGVTVSATGNTVTLSGQVRDASVASRAVEIAKGSGAVVVDNLAIPSAIQVLLQVRFAEVSRRALQEYSNRIAVVNPHQLSDNGTWSGSTSSDGDVTFSLLSPGAALNDVLRALKAKGEFKDLAEPSLLALPGKEASFLAGGEFPYPTVQSGAVGNGAITIEWKEFGIRLTFTPTIMRNGNIRLKVAPEVSSLDFANALTYQGFVVPSLLTRRAETEVELKEGQHLSIAGLIDNSMIDAVSKVPILGDLPIIGFFFRSKRASELRTELLVIVTPRIVGGADTLPPVPTGEPRDWDWSGSLRLPADTAKKAQ
jgi:pilus assembly protein CpaC